MHAAIAAAGLALGASAAILPRQQCCFSLTASGGQSGTLSQLYDGQNRIGGSGSAASYCISNGAITDSNGRGCILTPPTTQFQCDAGAAPESGFSVSGSGQLAYNGSSTFYSCPATSSGEANVYIQPVPGQAKCVQVSLSTGGQCGSSASGSGAGGSGSSSAAASTPVVSSAPYSSQVVQTSKPAPYTSQPAQSAPAESTTYACNPAHSYPNGASCISTAGSLTLVTPASTVSTSAESTTYACNPAHSYPNGASCISTAGSLTLVTPTSQGSVPAQSSSASVSSTPAAAGTTPATGTQPAATASGSPSACQTSLTGPYQTPHLIIPVSSSSPNTSYGTGYNGHVNSTMSTIFNFDIPQSYSGKTCSLVFLFPEKADLETSSYTFSGSGSIGFSLLSGVASQHTSWDSCPAAQSVLSTIAVQPGNAYVVTTEDCKAGYTKSIQLSSEGGLALDFFEDYNPSPLGLYLTSC